MAEQAAKELELEQVRSVDESAVEHDMDGNAVLDDGAKSKKEKKEKKKAVHMETAAAAAPKVTKGTPEDEAAKLEAKKLVKKVAATEKEGGN